MNRNDFDDLVNRLEQRYADRPSALRLNIMLWVVSGYTIMIGWLPAVLLVGGIALFGGMADLPGAGLWWCLGAVLLAVGLIQTAILLSVRIEAPKGIRVTRQTAPGLFHELDHISTAIQCRRFHLVRLTAEFNASVHRRPRLGLLGWSQTSLNLGWPLMMSLNPLETQAVLAHEFAHLSRQHGRFGSWIYGLGQTWETLVQQLQSGKTSAVARSLQGFLIGFVNWFWPRLNARIFVLSRAAEYEADRQAADLSGPDCLRDALWRINCFALLLDEEFWPEIRRLANELPEPPDDFLNRMRRKLKEVYDREKTSRWMEEAGHRLTDQADTHPSFSDRALALGSSVDTVLRSRFPVVPSSSACDTLFGRDAEQFEKEISAQWQQQNRDEWRRRHGRSAVLNRRLSSLETRPATGVNPQVLWEQATALADVNGMDLAEPVLRQLLEIQPLHGNANLMLGQHLLARQSPEGIDLLRRAIESDQDEIILHAGHLLGDYFRRTGESAELQTIRDQMAQFEIQLQKSRKERSTLKRTDKFLPHGLADDELQPLLQFLETSTNAGRVWLAQKSLQYLPYRRLFVVCVEVPRVGWLSNADADQLLANRIAARSWLPGQTLVIAQAGAFAATARRVKKVPDSLIYVRPSS